MTDATTVLVIKDQQTTPAQQNMGVMVDGSGTLYPQHNPRVNGAPVSTANPMPMADAAAEAALATASGYLAAIATAEGAGNATLATIAAQAGPFLGTDASNAAPAIGNVLKTATATHGFWAQNQSGTTLQVVMDNGSGANATIMLLGPGAGAGQQGASSDLIPFAGRVQVAGTAGSQFALRVW